MRLIGATSVFAIGAVSPPTPPKQQRASRSACLLALCERLNVEGIDNLLIESRREQDADDIRTITEAQQALLLPKSFPVPAFGNKAERLLWMPDAIAGAIREAETGSTPTWIDELYSAGVLLDIIRP